MAGVRIGVLGPLVVTGCDVPAARQQRVLLAALAAAGPAGVTADRLIDGLWRRVPADPGKALQVLVARLRKVLDVADIAVEWRDGRYRLHLRSDDVDAGMFHHLCERERELPADHLDERDHVFTQALSLWRDEPFGELADEPLLAATARELRLRRDDVIARHHQLRLDRGEDERLLPDVTAWAHEHPLDEGAWCRLATALHRGGRPTEALRTLRIHRDVVRRTAGLTPTSRVSELEAQLLAGQSRPSSRRSGNLRPRIGSLIGRAADVAEVTRLLTAGPIVTLVGTAGVGKTTLALHTADVVQDGYRDGVWCCELADVATGEPIVDALAETLGVRQQRGSTLLASVVAAFRDADALVVLDNCEHVLRSAADVATTLRTGCRSMTLLATSREPLGLHGESVYAVLPLPVQDAGDDAPASPAIELFIARAKEWGARVDEDPSTQAAIVEVCRLLDGVPLAIELAAARARTMPIGSMSRRLDERFRFLAQLSADRPARQRTLWDAIDWSYQLLDHREQELLALLSVFLGGFTVEAATAVSGLPSVAVEEGVWALADRSLVVLDAASGMGRYHLLDSIRHFAAARLLRRGLASATRDRHLRYFLDLARRSGRGCRGPDEAHHVSRISNELTNLRVAHHHAIKAGRHADAASLVVHLHEYAEWRQFFELAEWARATLEMPGDDVPLTPALHAVAGWGACIAGSFDAARDHARRGLDAEACGGAESGWLHDVLAHCAYFQGDVPAGLTHSDEELARARVAGDPYRLSYVLADSGIHATLAGRAQIGLDRAREALELAEHLENPALISMAQLAHGFTRREHQPLEAIQWFRRAADLADAVASTWTASVSRGELAVLLALHGDPHEAAALGVAQLDVFRRAGDASRASAVIRMTIPAIHRLTGLEQASALIVLDTATARRPHVTETFNDEAVAATLADLRERISATALAEAHARGVTITDRDLFDLARRTIQAALGNAGDRSPAVTRPAPAQAPSTR